MPTSKRPRKKHQPRKRDYLSRIFGVNHTPAGWRYSADDALKLQLMPHQELARLRDGTADKSTWHTLAARVNLGVYLVKLHYIGNTEAHECLHRALLALREIRHRNARLGKWGATAGEFGAVGDALSLVDEMQAGTTRHKQAQSLRAMLIENQRLIKQGRECGTVEVV